MATPMTQRQRFTIGTTMAIILYSTTISGVLSSTEEYGADVSFPMHRAKLSTNYPWLPHNVDPENNPTPDEYKDMPIQPLGNRQKFYDDFLQGCRDHYGKRGSACDNTERDRIAMSLRQPKSMVNYTDTGFKKIRAPEKAWKLIKEFWENNKGIQKEERWGNGNTYTNNWVSPTKMVSVEDLALRGAGGSLKQAIWNAARDTLQEWTGEELTQCSLYGIRVYPEGSVLATHVDRLPLVSSAIINVAQDLDEPWPIEVIGHDGKAHNVTMEPGDMVLYESHSILHGRPFPLKGRFYANIFIHFEPIGHSLRHHGIESDNHDANKKYKESVQKGHSGHEADHPDGLPSYIVPNSPEETKWRRAHPDGRRSNRSKPREFSTGSTNAHQAALKGDAAALAAIAATDKKQLSATDSNGWQPLHEASRGGHVEVVELLLKHGVGVNDRTNGEKGASPLWWAETKHGKDHPVSVLLRNAGGIRIEPEL